MVTRKSRRAKGCYHLPFTFGLAAGCPDSGKYLPVSSSRAIHRHPRRRKAAELDEPCAMAALIDLKLSQNSPFQDRPGACKLISPSCWFGDAAGMIDTVVKPKTGVKTKTERPRLHKVILVNDDFTPREFVVTVLKAEFRMTEDQAHKVMITAHRRGVCVVAVFTRDVAETKATRATDAGRAKGYPLLFTTEPEE
jgi:ATP-dependent Clp protease adaptor protein ClpS